MLPRGLERGVATPCTVTKLTELTILNFIGVTRRLAAARRPDVPDRTAVPHNVRVSFRADRYQTYGGTTQRKGVLPGRPVPDRTAVPHNVRVSFRADRYETVRRYHTT